LKRTPQSQIDFVRLTDIDPEEILAHMNDPRMAEHMPLLTDKWDFQRASAFVDMKEEGWRRHGLGCWAILSDGASVGWGGFQREGEEWDFALVLKPQNFGLGPRIAKRALDFAKAESSIPYVTFLLPPSRKKLGALKRLGAKHVGEVDYQGSTFLKFRLDTQ